MGRPKYAPLLDSETAHVPEDNGHHSPRAACKSPALLLTLLVTLMTGLLLVSALAVWRPEFRDRWSTASDTLGRVCREAQEANVTQEEHLPTLHLVFPLDARSHGERSCKSILAALVNGYKPVVVNWDLVLSINELYSAKIPGVYNFIMNNLTADNDYDMMLMADAYDLWLQLPPSTLIRRFQELEAKIVIGADQWCWPNDPNSPECQAAPKSRVPDGVFGETEGPRYANSGTVLGLVSDMRKFYARLDAALKERPGVNDQAFFNEILPEGVMTIDYWYRLFWTTAGPGEGLIVPIRHQVDANETDDIVPYDLVPPMIYHSMTGEVPVALHFNTDSTKAFYMDGLFGKLWWTRTKEARFMEVVRKRLRNATVSFAHDGSAMSYHELCPPSLLDLGFQD